MKRQYFLAPSALCACLILAGCHGQEAQEAPDITQCDIARLQLTNLVNGMQGLRAMREGDQTGAYIYIEGLVYNAAADILECQEYRYDHRVMVWLDHVAEYRRAHPRPPEARTPIDDRLDKLFGDYEAKSATPYRTQ